MSRWDQIKAERREHRRLARILFRANSARWYINWFLGIWRFLAVLERPVEFHCWLNNQAGDFRFAPIRRIFQRRVHSQ